MKTIFVYLVIAAFAAIGLYVVFQRVLFKAAPWEQYPGDQQCRQQNNYWLDQAVIKNDKRLCQKTIACNEQGTPTSQFDEIDRCQTKYDEQLLIP